MEKMNQVSVTEFMSKSKEEMYDMAVEMVEKYNRLVNICNDSCERIADLVTERDNLSKGVQKLIAEREDLIERHNVYTSALNKDIAAKAAKIELMQKEIDGRKAGYAALKARFDHMTASEEGWHANAQELVETCKSKNEEIEKLKETIKNKDIVIKMYYKIRVRQAKSICALKKELEGAKCNIGDRDSVMDGLYAEIERKQTENNTLRHRLHSQEERHANQLNAAADEVEKLKKSFNALQQEMATRYIAIETHNDICKTYEENMEMEGDHGRKGFKEYIEWLVKEEEEKFKESWKARLNEELEAIFKEEDILGVLK